MASWQSPDCNFPNSYCGPCVLVATSGLQFPKFLLRPLWPHGSLLVVISRIFIADPVASWQPSSCNSSAVHCNFYNLIPASPLTAAPDFLLQYLWPHNGLSTTAPTLTTMNSYRPKHNRCDRRIATQQTHVGRHTIGARGASRGSIFIP